MLGAQNGLKWIPTLLAHVFRDLRQSLHTNSMNLFQCHYYPSVHCCLKFTVYASTLHKLNYCKQIKFIYWGDQMMIN